MFVASGVARKIRQTCFLTSLCSPPRFIKCNAKEGVTKSRTKDATPFLFYFPQTAEETSRRSSYCTSRRTSNLFGRLLVVAPNEIGNKTAARQVCTCRHDPPLPRLLYLRGRSPAQSLPSAAVQPLRRRVEKKPPTNNPSSILDSLSVIRERLDAPFLLPPVPPTRDVAPGPFLLALEHQPRSFPRRLATGDWRLANNGEATRRQKTVSSFSALSAKDFCCGNATSRRVLDSWNGHLCFVESLRRRMAITLSVSAHLGISHSLLSLAFCDCPSLPTLALDVIPSAITAPLYNSSLASVPRRPSPNPACVTRRVNRNS